MYQSRKVDPLFHRLQIFKIRNTFVLERLLEHKLDHKYPTGQIIDSVRKYNCTHLDTNNWQFTYYDEIIDACGKALDMNLKKKYRTQQEVQRLLRY